MTDQHFHLKEIADAAKAFALTIPSPGKFSLARLPRYVECFSHRGIFSVWMCIGGKTRTLAKCRDVDTAARLSDIILVAFHPFRTRPYNMDKFRGFLNFDVETANSALSDDPKLADWVKYLLSYCQAQGWLRQEAITPGEHKPKLEKIDRDRLAEIELRLHHLEAEVAKLTGSVLH